MSGIYGVAELSDDAESTPKNVNGVVAIAGTPATLSSPDGSVVQLVLIKNPNKGPNANAANVVLLLNIDGSLTPQYISLNRGEVYYIPGVFTSVKIDSTVNGGKYEAIIWY